ncbi:WbqC family protein [Butyricimonas sp.]|uniref:WbqC family protein n=1 Tax=Butyricimonas sp. TaxID=1969738 RepID=UPI0025C6D672|nr:WbqC family protein [Butyricimonas sp.]
MNILVNTAYFPPIQYFSEIKNCSEILVEQHESYGKQSYRNRCDIMTANGVMTLSVPVVKGATLKILTKDVLVDYSTNWQKLHFKGIESAYKNSPYYDYYIDNLLPFFERKEKYLLDLNTKILRELMENIGLNRPLTFTEDYYPIPANHDDLRDVIHPKPSRRRTERPFTPKPYHQTFAERFPFTPNLSIIDLLFNMGPETGGYL